MKGWEETLVSLEEVIGTHFPSSSSTSRRFWAKNIYDAADMGAELQRLRGIDRPPDSDRANLKKSAVHLKDACKALEKVGVHGGNSLIDYAKKLEKDFHVPRNLMTTGGEAPRALADLIAGIAFQIERCSQNVREGGSLMLALGEEQPGAARRGQPLKTHAESSAVAAFNAYQELSGRRPTITVNPITSVASGAFLDFVQSIFTVLTIDASPERWAKHACKESKLTSRD